MNCARPEKRVSQLDGRDSITVFVPILWLDVLRESQRASRTILPATARRCLPPFYLIPVVRSADKRTRGVSEFDEEELIVVIGRDGFFIRRTKTDEKTFPLPPDRYPVTSRVRAVGEMEKAVITANAITREPT